MSESFLLLEKPVYFGDFGPLRADKSPSFSDGGQVA
jgi:hypothetical protein